VRKKGENKMQADAYDRLADWLVTTWRALPEVKTPELMDILKFQYTPEEAWLAIEMGPKGGKIDELAAKVGKSREELEPLIKSMEKKGTIYTEPGSEDPAYRPLGIELPGLVETAAWGDNTTPFKKELNKLWYKFKPIYVNEGVAEIGGYATCWCNVLALPPDAVPEENVMEQIKVAYQKDDAIAVAGCPCRIMEKIGRGNEVCDCIIECCMTFGEMARWAIENDWARKITLDECFDIIKRSAENGQVHTCRPGVIMCNCCKHACVNLYAMKLGKEHSYVPNHFYAEADPETCNSCGTCVERCPVDAVQVDNVAVVTTNLCIGCGVCASGCEEKSIRMVRRSEEEIARVDAEKMEAVAEMVTKSSPNWDLGF
jgi:electron transport complex protein RnfB